MKFSSLTAIVVASLGLASQASSAILFADNFQTNLSQFSSNTSGVIVAAPVGGGNALSFTQTIGGGDIFTANTFSSPTGNFHISFEYLGTCGASSCGGFLGFNNPAETWLAGSGNYPTAHPITETGGWQTISFDFASSSPIRLKLEDFTGANDGGAANNVYFRNLVLSGAVPEPASWALMIAGFAMTGVAARRRRTTVSA